MTDNNDTSGATPEEEGRVPKRVIGTPAPTGTQELVPGKPPADTGGAYVLDEKKARAAERVAAAFFTLSFIGGIAFIVFYAVWPGHVGNIDRATRSNYTLGISLTLVLLGLAVGLTIWVRNLVTTPEIVQERHTISSTPEERGMFTAMRPEPSPWNGWNRDQRNHPRATRRTARTARKNRPRLLRVRGLRTGGSPAGGSGAAGSGAVRTMVGASRRSRLSLAGSSPRSTRCRISLASARAAVTDQSGQEPIR